MIEYEAHSCSSLAERIDAGRAAITIAAMGKRVDENTSKVFDDALADSILGMGPPPSEPGSSLFVINLCASQAPFPTSNKTLPGLDSYRLYQVARREDGRTRHRLRLGFFASEADAEAVLATVRQDYPTAFTTCLCEEDKRFTRGYVPSKSAPAKPSISVVPTPAAATPAPVAKTVAPAPVDRTPVAPKLESKPTAAAPAPAPTQHIEVKAPPATVAPAPAPAKPALSAAELGFLEDLTWEPPALTPAAKASVHAEAAPAKPAAKKVATAAPAVIEAKPEVPATKSAAAPVKPAATKSSASPKVEDAGASMRVRALDLTFSDPPAPVAKATTATENKPFHVGKGVEIPSMDLQLEAAPAPATQVQPAPAAKAAAQKPAPSKQPTLAAATPARSTPQSTAKAPHPAPAAPKSKTTNPDLDSTQTIRALTSAEMNDESQEKWFAIQLAASEQPVNLDTMPHLDIFEAYTLYSVATAGSGKIVHSLRLGFFKEAVSAEAVSGYLKTFFNSPSVLRISVAEHGRFKDSPPPRRGATDSKPDSKVVELNARGGKPAIPTVTMEVVPPRRDTSATGSFRLDQTGSFNTSATGSFKVSASGSHKALTPSLKPAAKSAHPATKRSEPLSKHSATGKYKATVKKSLSEQLMDEARGVSLSESAIRKLPKNDSLLSRFVDKLTK